jgi:O-antigen ligase
VGRVVIWHNYIQIIKDHPYAGIGFGMQTYRKEIINPDYEINPSYNEVFAPHNTFMDVAVRCGLPGLALFLYILFAFARAGLGLIRNSEDPFIKKWALCLVTVFASYLIQGFFSDMLLGIQVKYFFIILSMMAILWKWHAESTNDMT